ncbi:hypothetical protein [Aquisalimonas sp.]|nr:hypothetical protein [Aquisalimonas sp.]
MQQPETSDFKWIQRFGMCEACLEEIARNEPQHQRSRLLACVDWAEL